MTTTRYYFDGATPAVSPGFASQWSSGNVIRGTLQTALPTTTTTMTTADTSASPVWLRLGQFVGPANLPARTLTGTATGMLFKSYTSFGTGSVATVRAIVRVVSADGATVRGTLVTLAGTSLVQNSSNRNSKLLPSTALTPVTAQAGDRLVVEIGHYAGNTSSLSDTHVSGAGSGAAETVDLPALDATTAAGRSWLDLVLDDPVQPPAGLAQVGATPTSIDVDWSAPATGPVPSSYDIRIDSGPVTSIDPSTVLATGAFLTITDLSPATSYLIEVRSVATSPASTSAWSSITATTDAPAPIADPDPRWWTHRVAAAVGVDPVAGQPVVQVRVWNGTGFVVDDTLSRALQSYQITYGRKDATSRCEAVTASLVWATPLLTSTPAVATRLQVALSPAVCAGLGLDPVDGIRFTGEVTDPTVAYGTRLTAAACAGLLGRGNRIPVDGTTWPLEDDGDRVGRILAASRVGLQAGTIDPGSVTVAAPTRPETVATLLEQVSVSALGQVLEQPSGVVDWHDADHRRDPAVAATLASAQVLRDVTWSQRVGSLVNDLDVKLADGSQVTVTDPESADPARYGPWPAAVDTILTSPLDGYALGVDIVGRRADPAWQLPDLTVDLVRTIAPADLAPVLQLRHGSLLELTGLPAAFPNAGRVFVEGYVETATPRTWSIAFAVSDPLQSGVGIRWIDWPDTDAYQWQDLDPDLTWLDLARIYDPADTL